MMKTRYYLFLTKVSLSFKTIAWVLSKWRYSLMAIVVAVFFFELTYWLFNLNIFWVVLTSFKLSFLDKVTFLLSPIQSIGGSNGYGLVVIMIILSITQGISISVLTFILRHQKKIDSETIGRSSLIGLLAIIGLGCPSCGTSLITPIVAIFISSSAVAVSEKITAIMMPLALVIGIYGLYVLGIKASSTKATKLAELQSNA